MAASKKFIIGLTGNIATGKSVVRKMLEHLGAYGIDADALAHRVIAKDAPGYQPVVNQFGKFVLDSEGWVDRSKLGKLVFSDAAALTKLENIVHPYVGKAVDHLVKITPHDVVVVEAIKLLESPLRDKVDTIWVSTSSEENQIKRLVEKRGMSEDEARQRMAHQSPQKEKVSAASVIIRNDGSFEETWDQVQEAWIYLFPDASTVDIVEIPAVHKPLEPSVDLIGVDLKVVRAKPGQAEDIANLVNRLSGDKTNLTRMDIMAAFGEKAYTLLVTGEQMIGVVGWQVENLVARIDEVHLENGLNLAEALKVLLVEIEEASRQLMVEAVLVFIEPGVVQRNVTWSSLGYKPRSIDELRVNAWKEAARESWVNGTDMLFKQLRVDRVLRPI